jgi:hypothetical protein
MTKLFPVQLPNRHVDRKALEHAGVQMMTVIPWEMIAPHEAQALLNHDQTLHCLAERCGLPH